MRKKAGLFGGSGDHTHNSLQCRRFLRARECFAREGACWNSKEGRKWWLQQYEHKQAAFARPKYACTAGYSHKYNIPLPPPSSPLWWQGLKIWMEGRSPCRENYQYKLLRAIRLLGNLRGKKLMRFGYFFFLERNRISFITKILAADELRSHVAITLGDKSRYDLIVKIN